MRYVGYYPPVLVVVVVHASSWHQFRYKLLRKPPTALRWLSSGSIACLLFNDRSAKSNQEVVKTTKMHSSFFTSVVRTVLLYVWLTSTQQRATNKQSSHQEAGRRDTAAPPARPRRRTPPPPATPPPASGARQYTSVKHYIEDFL